MCVFLGIGDQVINTMLSKSVILAIAGIGSANGSSCATDFNVLTNAISDPLTGLLTSCSVQSNPLSDCFSEVSPGEYSFPSVSGLSSSCATCARSVLASDLMGGSILAADCALAVKNRGVSQPYPDCYDELRDLFRTDCAEFSYPVKYACTAESAFFMDPGYPLGDLIDKCTNMGSCFSPSGTGYVMPSMSSLSPTCATCLVTVGDLWMPVTQSSWVQVAACVGGDGEIAGTDCTAEANTRILANCFAPDPNATTTPEPEETTDDPNNTTDPVDPTDDPTPDPEETTADPEETTAAPEETTRPSGNSAGQMAGSVSLMIVLAVMAISH